MNNRLFYTDKPVFGLDIGFKTAKVMQLDSSKKRKKTIIGYGVTDFDPSSVKEGVIIDPEKLASSIQKLFKSQIIGEINTNRCAVAVPVSRTFNRTVTLPNMSTKDLKEAIRLEADQYIPIPTNELYMDYQIISKNEKEIELLMVAVSKKVVNSYITLCKILGLEVVTIETTISAGGRLFLQDDQSNIPTVLIDFGSVSSDITIFDKTLIVTGTVPGGGDNFSQLISDALKVSKEEAQLIKTKYGLGVSKKQKEITAAITPLLDQLNKEIRRMIRYYEERSESDNKINQIVTMGGGANMPGISEYITDTLRLPARMCDPWQNLEFNDLQPPGSSEKTMYITVAGLSLIDPKEVRS